MGKPGQGNAWSLGTEYIGPGEVSPRTEIKNRKNRNEQTTKKEILK